MSLGSFLKLVEIQTKVASMIPFLLGTVYALYHYNNFSVKNFILMFVSLLAFDMATTVLNNYYDYKKANKTHGYNYESHNAIVRDNLREGTVVTVMVTLIIVAVIFGFLLYINTSVIVLVIGAISFATGVLYSFGPVPISRIPLGEIVSGGFMGFVIVFLSTYIHVYDQSLISLMYSEGMLNIDMNILEIIYVFLVSLPATIGIANIMLANNICDMEDDIENNRYTLPVFIGKDRALTLFKLLYYIAFVSLILTLLLGVIPIISIIALIVLLPINKHIKLFLKKQAKEETFVLAVKNFVLINGVLIISIVLGILFRTIN